MDLSYPPGESVNDGIDPDLCSLSYLRGAGYRSSIVSGRRGPPNKMDIESAYQLVPVHPQDRPLQAMQWCGHIYIDAMLPFRLCSAPKIFNAIADAFQWYLQQQGIQHVFHYLDDYVILGAPRSPGCAETMAVLDRACSFLESWWPSISVRAHQPA